MQDHVSDRKPLTIPDIIRIIDSVYSPMAKYAMKMAKIKQLKVSHPNQPFWPYKAVVKRYQND